MVKKIVKWVAILITAVAAVYAVQSFFQPEEQVEYLTEAVKRGNIHQTISATGGISPLNLVTVDSQTSGQIKKLYVKLGQQVKKGGLIAEINSTTQVNTLNTEKSKLGTYQAKLVSAEITLNSTKKKYRCETALWKEKATSKEDFEGVQDALTVAKASVTELKTSIRQTKISIDTAESGLGCTRITTTMDGTVVAILVEKGQTVNAVQSTLTIIQLANPGTMLNRVQIAEGGITKVKAGQDISFTTLSEPDEPVKAKLDSVDPGLTTMSLGGYTASADTTSNTVYYYARALVPNPDGKLSIGIATQSTIEISGVKSVLLVPTLTIKKHDGKLYVSVLGADGKAVEREITVDLEDSMSTGIRSGLKEGKKVVMSEVGAVEQVEAAQRMMKGDGPPR